MLYFYSKQWNVSIFPQHRKFNKCFCCWTPSCLRKKTTQAYIYYKCLIFYNGLIILLYSEASVHTGELIWNKYRTAAIPEYLFNFPSGKRKELLKTDQLFPSSFLFLYSWPCSQIQPFSPQSLQPVYWPPPKSVQVPPLQLLLRCPDRCPCLCSTLYQCTSVGTHTQPVSPAHTITWDFKILKYSISLPSVPLCLQNYPAKTMRKHSFKSLTLLERSLFLCKLPSV